MATLKEVLDKVAAIRADFAAYAAAHQTSEAADLDMVSAALDGLDSDIKPPSA